MPSKTAPMTVSASCRLLIFAYIQPFPGVRLKRNRSTSLGGWEKGGGIFCQCAMTSRSRSQDVSRPANESIPGRLYPIPFYSRERPLMESFRFSSHNGKNTQANTGTYLYLVRGLFIHIRKLSEAYNFSCPEHHRWKSKINDIDVCPELDTPHRF